MMCDHNLLQVADCLALGHTQTTLSSHHLPIIQDTPARKDNQSTLYSESNKEDNSEQAFGKNSDARDATSGVGVMPLFSSSCTDGWDATSLAPH